MHDKVGLSYLFSQNAMRRRGRWWRRCHNIHCGEKTHMKFWLTKTAILFMVLKHTSPRTNGNHWSVCKRGLLQNYLQDAQPQSHDFAELVSKLSWETGVNLPYKPTQHCTFSGDISNAKHISGLVCLTCFSLSVWDVHLSWCGDVLRRSAQPLSATLI